VAENKFYTYAFLDPRKPGNFVYGSHQFDFEPFYVGKGHGYRCNHLGSYSRANPFLTNKIKKIQKYFGEPIIIKLAQDISEKEAFSLEVNLIKTIGRKDKNLGVLINMTDGGEGTAGLKWTERQKANRPRRTGFKHSEETKRKIKLALKNIAPDSDETRRRKSEGQKGKDGYWLGKKFNDEHKKKQSDSLKKMYNSPHGASLILAKKNQKNDTTNMQLARKKMLSNRAHNRALLEQKFYQSIFKIIEMRLQCT